MPTKEHGDLDYPVKVFRHKGRNGKTAAYRINLTPEHVAFALGCKVDEIPALLRAKRIVLENGTRQILIRLRNESEPEKE